ncbi:hypothetical protein M3Y94_01025700 [Aphelenchoides besseyi]|nr:hypothetical protein M3Y94_01025700 [Aphelenchoides besseyi]
MDTNTLNRTFFNIHGPVNNYGPVTIYYRNDLANTPQHPPNRPEQSSERADLLEEMDVDEDVTPQPSPRIDSLSIANDNNDEQSGDHENSDDDPLPLAATSTRADRPRSTHPMSATSNVSHRSASNRAPSQATARNATIRGLVMPPGTIAKSTNVRGHREGVEAAALMDGTFLPWLYFGASQPGQPRPAVCPLDCQFVTTFATH